MKIRFLSKLAVTLFLVLTATGTVFPCRCVNASLNAYYRRADAVVTAQVVSVSTDAAQNTTARLEISEAWKKALPSAVEVITGSTCAYEMQAGESHLLYLQAASAGQFSTMKCQGNLPSDQAGKSKNWLKRYGKKSSVARSADFLRDFYENDLTVFLLAGEAGAG